MSNQILDAALAYAARGYPVFPVQPNKAPYADTRGVLDATTNPETIKAWWAKWPRANIAMDVGAAGMMVVEVDSYKAGFDPDALKALNLPETRMRVRSPRGGEHLYFALANNELVAMSQSRLAPCVDVRSFHSYVLLPPSRTADGSYEWLSEGKPAYRTDEMVRLANGAREKSATRDVWIIEPDLPDNITAATEWLRNQAKIAVEGQGGDGMAYATAAAMRSYGLSEATAFDLMWQHWNPRCIPPWSADEVDHLEAKVRHAYEYSTSDPGNMTPAYRQAKSRELFKPVVLDAGGREVTAGRFRAVDRAGMANIKPASWLIEDFLPIDAYTMIVGAPGTFKTFLALDVALTIATGFAANPTWSAIECGPVLYAAGEARSGIGNRVRAWEKTHWHGEKVEGFTLIDPVPNVGEDWTPFIQAALALNNSGYKLAVIDTVGRAMAGLNENAQQDASKLTQQVERLQSELGCTVLCLHHIGHGHKERARGSMVFQADVDTMVRIDREDNAFTVDLHMLKQKDAPEWTKAKRITLAEVDIGVERPSLAAVPVAVSATPAQPQQNKGPRGTNQHMDSARKMMLLKLYAQVVESVLGSNKSRAWTQSDLAIAVAADARVDQSAKTLQNTWLTELRESPEIKAKMWFDPLSKRWHFRA